MTPEFLADVIACPLCGARFPKPGASEPASIACEAGHAFPVADGVPILFAEPLRGRSAQVRSRFDFQWRRFGSNDRLFGKERGAMRENLVNAHIGPAIRESFYPGKRVLDAGCGHGRYVEEFARLGAEAVGLDAADYVLGRLRALPGAGRAAFVQGDVARPPFREAAFDLVFSDGVLHHTPDARGAFRALAALVKPGGYFYVWLYPKEGALREGAHRALRSVTTRLPAKATCAISYALVPLLSVTRTYSGTSLRSARWSECAQVVFDWLAPAYQSHHTEDEVAGWFEEAGFEAIETLPVPVGLIGRRRGAPARAAAASEGAATRSL